jgi:antitoxin component HigA of HigAB toxin-antitoxin module
MRIESIDNENTYHIALVQAEKIMRITPEVDKDSPEGRELMRLAALIEEYEAKHYPMGEQ